jgi:zinc transporter ZupT
MTPIVQLYWVRVSLGIVAAVVTSILARFLFFGNDLTPLLNSITVALLIYFITYYILKPIYKDKIEKQSKILSTGIGMYFFAWIAFFVLFYTILQVYFPLT